MSDLSERLRRRGRRAADLDESEDWKASADRIDELEAALREIAGGKHVDPFGNILNQPSREAAIARRWLEGNDE
jgi:hypothetical protein